MDTYHTAAPESDMIEHIQVYGEELEIRQS
jgi:hypothetical protein